MKLSCRIINIFNPLSFWTNSSKPFLLFLSVPWIEPTWSIVDLLSVLYIWLAPMMHVLGQMMLPSYSSLPSQQSQYRSFTWEERKKLRHISYVPAIKFAFWTGWSSGLIGSINTVAEIIVNAISSERIWSVLASDHLRSKVLLLYNNRNQFIRRTAKMKLAYRTLGSLHDLQLHKCKTQRSRIERI